MNGNSDNHKPLSPEELFRLLESKREEEALQGDGLDDFEREALEGFSMHVSADKARELTNEVHGLIDEVVSETKKPRALPRFVWFAAAASIVFGIILSAYFLTQNAKETPELALNKQEDVQDQKPAVQAVPEEKALMQEPAVVPLAEEKEMPKSPAKEPVLSEARNKAYEPTDGSNSASPVGAENSASLGPAFGKKKEEVAKDQNTVALMDEVSVTGTSEQEDLKTAYSSGTADAKRAAAPKGDLAKNSPAEEKAQKESPVVTYGAVQPASSYKMKSESKKTEARRELDSDAAMTSTLKTADGMAIPAGYYTGGEKALLADVAAWMEAHHYEPLKGGYNIHVKVAADGVVEVKELRALPGAVASAEKYLKQALMEVKGWRSLNGEAVFTLNFKN